MNNFSSPKIKGQCKLQQVAYDEDGNPVPIEDAVADETLEHLQDQGYSPQLGETEDDNLVVNGGRRKTAQLVGGLVSGVDLNRLWLGDLGNTSKSNAAPNLDDDALYHEIEDLSGQKNGVFLLEDKHIKSPPPDDRYPADDSAWAPTEAKVNIYSVGSGEETRLEDPNADFSNLGVQPKDQVVLNTSTTHPLRLGVESVKSTTELVLHNPRHYETPQNETVEYSIEIPGTQILVTRYISGDNFDPADWGPGVLVQEAGLLFSDDTLFNRVIYYPNDDDKGLFFQHSSVNGNEIGLRIEWQIVY